VTSNSSNPPAKADDTTMGNRQESQPVSSDQPVEVSRGVSPVESTVPAPAAAKPKAAAPPRMFGVDARFIAPIFITMILLAGQLSFGILESYPKTLLAIATAILAELILGKIFTGKFPHLASAYISGISVGILVRSPDYWPYALCSLITITSKY